MDYGQIEMGDRKYKAGAHSKLGGIFNTNSLDPSNMSYSSYSHNYEHKILAL